mgnify:CR=1 FL=1
MGIFKKIFKGVGKVFKKIGRGVKKVFKKFGKFMGKIGIAGQIAMMFILPGIGAALMKGFGAMWTGVVGQTAAQATAAATATTQVAANTATQAAIAGATDAAAGKVIEQAALKAATKTAMAGIKAGTTTITKLGSGMLGSGNAVVRGAGMVLEKGAQFASTIKAGYQTVSQAVTGAFTETGKWIGGKLGMKTAEGAAMQGSWANYSKGVTDSFAKLGDKAAEFWSPINMTQAPVGTGTVLRSPTLTQAGSSTVPDFNIEDTISNFKSPTDIPRGAVPEGTGSVLRNTPLQSGANPLNLNMDTTIDSFGSTGTQPTSSLLVKAKDYVMGGETLAQKAGKFKDGVVADIAATPGRIVKQGLTDAVFGEEPLAIEEEPLNLWDQAGYTPQLPVGNADIYAQAAAPVSDFVQFITGNEDTFGNYGVKEGQFGGAAAYANYFKRLQNFGAIS